MELQLTVEQHIAAKQLLADGDCIVVAVSGGPDSVALLHLLYVLSSKHQWKLVVAHVNHGFRVEESREEALQVEALARTLGLPCEIAEVNVPAYIAATSLNPQVAAREKRYDFLHKIARKYEAGCIALAHHADDQAETMMMRIVRGTGPSGLGGIRDVRMDRNVKLIRPLLRIHKEQLIDYCHQEQIPYSVDASNASRKYFRNQVRLDIIPFLQKYNEELPHALIRLSEVMQAEEAYMQQETERVFQEIVFIHNEDVRLPRHRFMKLPLALQRRLIKLILSYLACPAEWLDFTRIEMLRESMIRETGPNMRQLIYGHMYFVREYEQLSFIKEWRETASFQYECQPLGGAVSIPEIASTFEFHVIDHLDHRHEKERKTRLFSAKEQEAFFDMDQLELPLCIRNRRDGDRIEPFGLNGSKKVKNMFIDAKVAQRERDRIPILLDAKGQILWIPGYGRSRFAAVDPNTRRVLHVKVDSFD
ncbi:tRNA lysidine(34) synthetase TilS [Paenibacillus sp. N1-5-1-14]|uniref:tRNA lysidine(34) synthetase TilS n=1 Tax=Paenibacillus radicibacter TaxID=2972488 RepID=UPI002159401D|nr:tRNA lysidine(34) synthetase TilS [Paenibacillus radicibacter]MCR8645851.1 tRNA lysidine(34) synthetase TilS [Paenibacillus radicibacter]